MTRTKRATDICQVTMEIVCCNNRYLHYFNYTVCVQSTFAHYAVITLMTVALHQELSSIFNVFDCSKIMLCVK